MSLSEAQQPAEHLPPGPPAIVESASNAGDIGHRFQELIAEIFDRGLIKNKTEEELKQMAAQLVLTIMAEQAYHMSPEVMKHYFDIRDRISEEKWEIKGPALRIVRSPQATAKSWLAGAVIALAMRRRGI